MDKESLEQNRPSGNGILRDLYHEDAGAVRHALEKIGEMGKGDHEAMRALQDFLRREQRMPLRVLAAQMIAKITTALPHTAQEFKKPGIFQCPGAEKVKRVEVFQKTTLNLNCPIRIIPGMAIWADENDFAGLFCQAYKRRVETVFVPALGTDREFLFYGNWFWCFLVHFIPPFYSS